MEEREVCAWSDRQMVVSDLGGVGLARVHHHDGEPFRVAFLALQQSLEQHGMALGRVGADQEGHGAMVQIVVAAGRTIRSQASCVSGHCGAHAQPRVGIEVVGSQRSFQEFLRQVVILGVKLP